MPFIWSSSSSHIDDTKENPHLMKWPHASATLKKVLTELNRSSLAQALSDNNFCDSSF